MNETVDLSYIEVDDSRHIELCACLCICFSDMLDVESM